MGLDDIMDFGGEDTNVEEYDTEFDHSTTVSTLTRHFEGRSKLGKDLFNTIYNGKKTILGTPIKSTDKIISVLLISSDTFSNKFISVSIRYVSEREIKKVSKKYISLDNSRREPLLVECKYMESVKYQDCRQKIVDQFL